MELYTLDPLLRRTEVIDRFNSLIWTERWAGWGDFELNIQSTYESRSVLTSGTLLAMNMSNRVMKVETIEDGVDSDGIAFRKVKGRSLETLFEDRVARPSTANLTAVPTWDITDTPGAIMRKIVHDVCVTGVVDLDDRILNMVEMRHPDLDADTIAEPIDPIGVKLDPKSVYQPLVDIGNTWLLGFRLLRGENPTQLYFDVYAGVNRTTAQSAKPPVVFSPELDNLTDTNELQTIENEKNVAYVFAKNGFMKVIPADVDPDIDGFERRVLTVNAEDIDLPAGAALDAAMLQRGKEALAEHRAYQAFDGEIRQDSQYKYNRDYFLGDLVEQRNVDGVANQMRVTEQIFVEDREGERNYPTLALNVFVNTGSWLSAGDKKWIDYDADTTTTWSTLP